MDFELSFSILFSTVDPYVRVDLSQPGRSDCKEQTKRKKKTSQACFNEQFIFNISPRIADLNYTSLTLNVFDHEAIKSDDLIGQVRIDI